MRVPSRLSLLFGVVAVCFSASHVNPGLVDSSLPAGPGLTLDESFNIEQGVRLARALSEHGPLLWVPGGASGVFEEPEHLPDHPPLGRLVLGLAHEWLGWLIPGLGSAIYHTAAARLGSGFAFGMTVLLLVEFSRRRFGALSAAAVGLMLVGMPVLMGHSRLAALETCTNLAWTAAVVSLAAWWTRDKPPTNMEACWSGVLWGLLLLTKVQGILLPPAVCVWAVVRFGRGGLRPICVWTAVGLIVAFCGWPWLWQAPLEHTLQYLGRTTNRSVLYCWYLGERYEDRLVPWHYPWVMLGCSLPLWAVAGLALRVWQRRLDVVERLLVLTSLLPLVVFSIPGVPVYDGVRLFLPSLPGIAVLAGRGWGVLMSAASGGQLVGRTADQWRRLGPALLLTGLALIPLPWTMQPFAINQYGVLCGGNRGAAALGLEACYWGDSLNGDFWSEVPEGSVIEVAPVSHPLQLRAIELMVPLVSQRRIELRPYLYGEQGAAEPERLLLLHRLADLRVELRGSREGWTEEFRAELSGVPLARLMRRGTPTQ
ncbi:MAG: hypothetical protein RL215_911 [Planctomycetota bacterium]